MRDQEEIERLRAAHEQCWVIVAALSSYKEEVMALRQENERLRAQAARYTEGWKAWHEEAWELRAENERLRAVIAGFERLTAK